MSNGKKRSVGDVDVEMVRQLAQILVDAGLTEIEYTGEDWRLRLAKQAVIAAAPPTAQPAAVSVPAQAPAAAEVPGKTDTEALAAHPGLLKSPMVGIVYTSAEPSAPPFVTVGDSVAVGDTMLLIEAMKVFNPIKAHRAGRIERIFVSAGMPVEYGEPLLLIS